MTKNIIDNLIVIGDRVLVEPSMATKKTKGGLLLPAGYQEKEEVQTGYIIKCGPDRTGQLTLSLSSGRLGHAFLTSF